MQGEMDFSWFPFFAVAVSKDCIPGSLHSLDNLQQLEV